MLKDLAVDSNLNIETDPDPNPVSNRDPKPENNKDAFCSLLSIAACAKTALDNMYWLDYAFCAMGVNFCLLEKFGGCAQQLCK